MITFNTILGVNVNDENMPKKEVSVKYDTDISARSQCDCYNGKTTKIDPCTNSIQVTTCPICKIHKNEN